MQINYELEKFNAPPNGEAFYTVTLTGNTYQAKEIIKQLSDFRFGNAVGHEKAWRSKPYLASEVKPKAAEIKALIQKMYDTLKAAGYTVVLMR